MKTKSNQEYLCMRNQNSEDGKGTEAFMLRASKYLRKAMKL